MAKIMNLVDSKMLEKMQTPINPLQRTLNTLDSDMQCVLQRSDMSDEEKVQAYNQILQRYLEYKKTNEKPLETITVSNKPAIDIKENVLRTIPKTMKRKAEGLLERIKEDPDTSWNERGEFIYRGQVIAGTNIVDLINDVVRHRKGFESRGRYDFARALRHKNVPHELIGNDKIWNWMHRDSASSDAFSTADETFEDTDDESRRSRSVLKTPARKRERNVKTRVKQKINWESRK